MTHRIHINIGSNSGCRHALIERAAAAVASALGGRMSRSEIIESEPWGFESPNSFLNLGLMIETDRLVSVAIAEKLVMDDAAEVRLEVFALSVLSKLREIERSIDPSPHRDANGSYIDRAIDIDLISVDDLVMESPELTLPHPHAHERDFVLRPIAQLDPLWRHPVLRLTADELLCSLSARKSRSD